MQSIQGKQISADLAPISSFSNWKTFLLFLNINLGGIIPVAPVFWFDQGLIFGLIIQLVGSLLALQPAIAVVRLSMQFKAYTEQDLTHLLFGKRWASVMIAIQFFGLASYSVSILYLSATTLQPLFMQIFTHVSPQLAHVLCVLLTSALLLPFILKREVKQLGIASLLMFISLLLLIILLILYVSTNYHIIREKHPHTDFSVPLWPISSFKHSAAKFFTLAYSFCCLQAGMPILHSQPSLNFRNGFYPILGAVIVAFLIAAVICIPIIFAFSPLLLKSDNFFAIMSVESSDVFSVMAQLVFIFISIFNAPVYLFNTRETILLFLQQNFKCVKLTPNPDDQEEVPLLGEQLYSVKMYERVRPPIFWGFTLGCFGMIVIITLLLQNMVTYLELISSWWIIFINTVFPNICILYWRGARQEKLALTALIIGVLATIMAFVTAILDLTT